MLRPRGEIVNALLPASAAPETPVMPDGGPPTTVIWPPVRKVCLPAKVRVTESFAALYATEKPVIGLRMCRVCLLARFVVMVAT